MASRSTSRARRESLAESCPYQTLT
jgi:hypothetical protein